MLKVWLELAQLGFLLGWGEKIHTLYALIQAKVVPEFFCINSCFRGGRRVPETFTVYQ